MRELADQADRDLITGADAAGLTRTLFVEAGAGSGKTSSLIDRIVRLVRTGEAELAEIAAITFTEKAATELRDRLRLAFDELVRSPDLDPAESVRAATALDQLDGAPVSTLHAFAQRLLTEMPIEAGLPPNIDVLDEVRSGLEFEERWQRFVNDVLDDEQFARALRLGRAAGLTLDHLRLLAREFDQNWDLATDPARVPDMPPPDAFDLASLLACVDEAMALLDECDDHQDKLAQRILTEMIPFGEALRAADHDELLLLERLAADKPTLRPGSVGQAKLWPDGGKDRVLDCFARAREARLDCLQAIRDQIAYYLAATVREFVQRSSEQRVAAGRLEFHDLLVLCRRLLSGADAWEVRQVLRDRYRRLLLDEFQDTDPLQIEIAVLLASPDPATEGRAWQDLAVDDGRLFFVGDPKQSIYRFRRADISLYLKAADVFAGDGAVALTTNFRTVRPIIEWVNHVFGRMIQHVPDSQPGYLPLDWHREPPDDVVGPPVTVLGAEALPKDGVRAEALRDIEAAAVADTIVRAVTEGWKVQDGHDDDGGERWRPARLGDMTILLPARTSLPMLERALERRDIPYRAEASSLVYATPEVRAVLLALRAAAEPADTLALVGALRSVVFGCGDDDLFRFKQARGVLNVRARLDHSADDPVVDAIGFLRELHEIAPWTPPSQLIDRICRRQRLFELGHVIGHPRDLWRRLRFVIDQARAWSEAEGGTLREYVNWARLQASESARVAEVVLPETDHDAVRIMTVHAAKGLEFPIAIVSGTSTATRLPGAGVDVVWPSDGGRVGIRIGGQFKTRTYEELEPLDEQMSHHERIRLLYVACTRARDHLVVSTHRTVRAKDAEDHRYTNAELLAAVLSDGPVVDTPAPVDPEDPGPPLQRDGDDAPVAEPVVDLATWTLERARVLGESRRPRSLAATAVHRVLTTSEPSHPVDLIADDVDAEVTAGVRKDPRDLDLPAWQKGRYGTAIGRAVHAVLQTIDLRTGEGLEQAAAAQAAAEGVLGREADIAGLAAAALTTRTVRGAVAAADRWRETYVAVPIGDTVLEGYVDLLYRDDDGLVVADYKTASTAADLDRRVADYRAQGAAYAHAVAQSTGEPVARVVFVFLTPEGAFERELPDLDAAVAEVTSALAVHSSA